MLEHTATEKWCQLFEGLFFLRGRRGMKWKREDGEKMSTNKGNKTTR